MAPLRRPRVGREVCLKTGHSSIPMWLPSRLANSDKMPGVPQGRFDIFSHNEYALYDPVRRANRVTRLLGEFIMWRKLLLITALTSGVIIPFALAQEQEQPVRKGGAKAIIGAIERLDPRFDELIPKDAQMEKIAEGFIWTEGAVWYKPGKCLLFSDIPNNVVVKWEPGKGTSEYLKPSGYTGLKPRGGKAGDEPGSNGLSVDAQGRLHLCEHGDRRVTRIEKNGKKTVLADNYMGKKFNSPNDLALHPNGDIYFTDPPYGLAKGDKRELDFTGVYRINAKDGTLSLVAKNLSPNGIALSPDAKKLYVTHGGKWMVFPVNADGATGDGKVFVDPAQWTVAKVKGGGVDGLKCDTKGNIFATGPGGVCVIAPDGTLLGRFLTADRTANLCFGGEDGQTLFVCVNHRIGMVRTTTKGIGW